MLNLIMCIALVTATGPIRTSTNPENLEVISANWTQVTVLDMKPFTTFAVGSKYHIFALNSDGIYNIIPPYGFEFHFHPNWVGFVSALDVGSDGTVWGANLYGQFFSPLQFGNVSNVHLPHAANITIGNYENIWALDKNHKVYHYIGGQNWYYDSRVSFSCISAADDGSVIGIYLNGSMAWYKNRSWISFETPNTFTTFTIAKIGSSSNIWALTAGGNVWNWTPSTRWQAYSGQLLDIDVASDRTVMGLDLYGNLVLLNQ